MDELKLCPFCAGEGEVRAGNLYDDRVYLVRCQDCGAKTDFVFVNHPSLDMVGRVKEDTRYTEEQARCKAIEAWNRRANDDHTDKDYLRSQQKRIVELEKIKKIASKDEVAQIISKLQRADILDENGNLAAPYNGKDNTIVK